MRHKSGFTLVELVITMVLVGILAGLGSQLIAPMMTGYGDTIRRAGLARFADVTSRRLSREIQAALPNSVRILATSHGFAMEFVPTKGVGVYRSAQQASGAGDVLRFDAVDTGFDVLGPVPQYAAADYLVIANFGDSSSSDFYGAGTLNRSTLSSSNASSALWSTDAAPHKIQFSDFQFPVASESERFYITAGAVSYSCDTLAKTLTRYSGYAMTPSQQAVPNTPSRTDVLASDVASCRFSYAPGVTSRTGLVTMEVVLSNSGESVDLFVQAHVIDQP